MILEWRGHSKVISTYLEPLIRYVISDGRIHTNYNLRNFHWTFKFLIHPISNFPSKTGKETTRYNKAPTDHILICCDYGQIEARLIGAASQDPVFCKATWEIMTYIWNGRKRLLKFIRLLVVGSALEDKKR